MASAALALHQAPVSARWHVAQMSVAYYTCTPAVKLQVCWQQFQALCTWQGHSISTLPNSPPQKLWNLSLFVRTHHRLSGLELDGMVSAGGAVHR